MPRLNLKHTEELSFKIIELLKQGLTYKQIGRQLNYSECYISKIIHKTDKSAEVRKIKEARNAVKPLNKKVIGIEKVIEIVNDNKLNTEEKAKTLRDLNLPYYRIAKLLNTTKGIIYFIINGESLPPAVSYYKKENWVLYCLECLELNPYRNIDNLRETLLQEPLLYRASGRVNEIIKEVEKQFYSNPRLVSVRESHIEESKRV